MKPHYLLITVTLSSLLFTMQVVVVAALAAATAGDAAKNPFTPKAFLLRYWNKQISNHHSKPQFLISKASPLSTADSAAFAKLAADTNSLSAHLPSFCSAAKLLCFTDLSPSLEKHTTDSNFAEYSGKNFTNYGTGSLAGVDAFKNYSVDENVVADSFKRYSHNAVGHNDKFSAYGDNGNVIDQKFDSYGGGATGGTGKFTAYNGGVNIPNLNFNNYGSEGNGRAHSFTTYTKDTNAGSENFKSYGKNENGAPNEFTNYGTGSNVMGSGFDGYGGGANGANDTFTNYGNDGNVPENIFKSYGENGNGAVENFKNYRDRSNVGDDTFTSYGKKSNAGKVNFANYGKSFNEGTDKFSGYGEGAQGQVIGFKTYGVNNTFKDYTKDRVGVSFKEYDAKKGGSDKSLGASMAIKGKMVNRWVEPGKFFRESMLKKGTMMPMPDIRDKMPQRSFLPRSVLSKLPFTSTKIPELKIIFHAADNSSMEGMIVDALTECERAPSRGETKRCVGSIEDMIDFATSVLGRNVAVRTTENVQGSKQNVMIGSVKGINSGKVTQSVSCHQSLYPYLLYYCHSVPKVRVYESDILDPNTKTKINHGVAICHIDTSAWSPTHGAFLALGYGPGRIEVCHWIFENDMTWTVAD